MAGPNLTPATVAEGLQRSVFPNPEHPNRPGRVGFNSARFAMTTDGAEWWWSPTATSAYGQAGTHCYLDGGARHGLGSWPKGEKRVLSRFM